MWDRLPDVAVLDLRMGKNLINALDGAAGDACHLHPVDPLITLACQYDFLKHGNQLIPMGDAHAVRREFGVEPAYEWEGASIPVLTTLASATGAEPVLVGFGMREDNIHSPNESFSLKQFEEGYRYVCAFLSTL